MQQYLMRHKEIHCIPEEEREEEEKNIHTSICIFAYLPYMRTTSYVFPDSDRYSTYIPTWPYSHFAYPLCQDNDNRYGTTSPNKNLVRLPCSITSSS